MQNYNKKIIFFPLLALLTFSLAAFATEPPNLSKVKQTLIQYHNSGQYAYEINAVIQRATFYLKQRVAANQKSAQPKKLAAVFDIDETALSNYASMIKMNFGGTGVNIKHAEERGNDPALPGTLKLFQLAKQDGVTIFFVTGRRLFERKATIKNLTQTHYTGWKQLFMKPNGYSQSSLAPYKSGARKKIETMGHDIILSIGDQWSDLQGGYADATFKLPNPYYYIP